MKDQINSIIQKIFDTLEQARSVPFEIRCAVSIFSTGTDKLEEID